MEREWFVNKGRGRSKGHWCWEKWRCLSSPGLFRCTVHQHCSPALMLTVYVYVYVKQNNIGFQVWYHKRERIFNLSFFLEVHICKNSAIKVTLPPLHLPLAAESIHRGCKDVYHFFFFFFFFNHLLCIETLLVSWNVTLQASLTTTAPLWLCQATDGVLRRSSCLFL